MSESSKSAWRRSGMRASPLVLDRSFEILPPGQDVFGRLRGQLLGRVRLKNRGAGCACGGIFRGLHASLRRRRRSGRVNCARSAVSAGQGDGAPRLGRSGTLEAAGFRERILSRDSSKRAFGRWPVSTGGPGATAVLRPGRNPVAGGHAGRNSSAAWHGGDVGWKRAMLPWRERHEMDWLSLGDQRASSDGHSGKAAILQMRFARRRRTAFRAPRIRAARGRPENAHC